MPRTSLKIIAVSVFASILGIFWFVSGSTVTGVKAQGETSGLESIITRGKGSTQISVSNLRTAPNSEIVVQSGDTVEAVAIVGEGGVVSFSFLSDAKTFTIHSQDVLGTQSDSIEFSGTQLRGQLLPPTIVVGHAEATGSVTASGFTFPGAEVVLQISQEQDLRQPLDEVALADNTGHWTISLPDLPDDSYEISATAQYGAATSQRTGLISVEITQPTPVVVALYNASPVSKIVAPVAGATLAIQSGLLGTSLRDLLIYARQIIFWVVSLFVPDPRRKRWGVVYNAVTKQPVRGAIIRLIQGKKLIETSVTGAGGVFSFLLQPGDYTLNVRKPGFSFPSQEVINKQDGEYLAVYRGETLSITPKKPLVRPSIPLDPQSAAEEGSIISRIVALIKRYSVALNSVLLVPGFMLATASFFQSQSTLNAFILMFYVGSLTYFFGGLLMHARSWGEVVGPEGKAQAGVALSLLDAKFGRLVQRRVTDGSGRYQFLVPKGSYKITVSSPEWQLDGGRSEYHGDQIDVVEQNELIKPKIAVVPARR